jgi:peptidoglycan/xylan/chitin deacetylase (PgdA/CDA1 family)
MFLLGAAAAAAAYVAYQARSPNARRWGCGFHRGPLDRQQLALTFDDGPSDWTLGVLEALERHRVPATFFFCGMNVERHPDLARLVHKKGHEMGNHTYSHPWLLPLSGSSIHAELARTQQIIEQTTGVLPQLFRPPYGCRAPGLLEAERRLGLTEVLWTVIGNDWNASAAAITSRVLQGAEPGGIVCLHDGDRVRPYPDRSRTVIALRELLAVLLDEGYSFVTAGAVLRGLRLSGSGADGGVAGLPRDAPGASYHHQQLRAGVSWRNPPNNATDE